MLVQEGLLSFLWRGGLSFFLRFLPFSLWGPFARLGAKHFEHSKKFYEVQESWVLLCIHPDTTLPYHITFSWSSLLCQSPADVNLSPNGHTHSGCLDETTQNHRLLWNSWISLGRNTANFTSSIMWESCQKPEIRGLASNRCLLYWKLQTRSTGTNLCSSRLAGHGWSPCSQCFHQRHENLFGLCISQFVAGQYGVLQLLAKHSDKELCLCAQVVLFRGHLSW